MTDLIEESTKTITALNVPVTIITSTLNKWFYGYIDLTNMALGDTVKVTANIQIKTGGNSITWRIKTPTGVQTEPNVYIPPFRSYYSMTITVEQTAGIAIGAVDYQIFGSTPE
jgi:hypothetical protein